MSRKSRKNVYIDIEGVILTRGGVPADNLENFLNYILHKFNVYWLTTRCRGDTKYTIEYLSKYFSTDIITLLKKIKPTIFSLDKTEAIDFKNKFYWLDDEIFASEKNTLIRHDKYNSWIQVNLMENPNQLAQLMNGSFLT